MFNAEDDRRTHTDLLQEIATLRERLAAREATLQAIQDGEVDAFIITTPYGPQVFTIQTADHSYRSLVEAMQQGAMILSTTGIIVYANQSLASLLKLAIEDVIGRSFQQFFSPRDAQLLQSCLTFLDQNQQNAIELFLKPPNHPEIPVYITFSELSVASTAMTCAIITDLTQRKRYEATLANEQLARLILDQAGEVILVCDPQGRIIRASQVATELWGMPLLGRLFNDLGIQRVSTALPEASASEQLDLVERSEQSELLEQSERLEQLERSEPLKRSERSTRSTQLDQPQSSLFPTISAPPLFPANLASAAPNSLNSPTSPNSSNSPTSPNFSNSPNSSNSPTSPNSPNSSNSPISPTSPHSPNSSNFPISPTSPHSPNSSNFPTFRPTYPLDICPILQGASIQNLEVTLQRESAVWRAIGAGEPGDSTLHLILSARPLEDATKQILGAVVVLTDITERKRLEQQQQQTLAQLEQYQRDLEQRVAERTAALYRANLELQHTTQLANAASHAKSEFLANMSHEIRTPMNAVLGFTDLLKPLTQDPLATKYLDTIASSGTTLLSLINDILDLSKIEAGCLEIHPEPINIRTLVQGIYDIFAQKASLTGIDFQCSVDPAVPSVLQLDDVRIRQILFNVVGNAFKFTEKGYIKVRVWPWNRGMDSKTHISLKIEVQDTGIGIDPEDQNRIFAAFTQSEGQSTRKYGGTGLGLAITQRLVDLMQGETILTSTPGYGTTFTFRFPKVAVGDLQLPGATRQVLDLDLNQFAPAKILVVDDVQSNRDLIAGYFLKTHHMLTFALNGTEAIRWATAQHPDLILMDLRMPGMNGLDAAKSLKHLTATQGIPIVIVTASTQAKEEAELRQISDGILTKPLRLAHLVDVLTSLLPRNAHYLALQASSPRSHADAIPASTPILMDLSPTQQQDLSKQLQTIAIESWEQVRTVMAIQDVEAFIYRLNQVVATIPYAPLVRYVETLHTQLDEFDWDCLPTSIAAFTEILETVFNPIEP